MQCGRANRLRVSLSVECLQVLVGLNFVSANCQLKLGGLKI